MAKEKVELRIENKDSGTAYGAQLMKASAATLVFLVLVLAGMVLEASWSGIWLSWVLLVGGVTLMAWLDAIYTLPNTQSLLLQKAPWLNLLSGMLILASLLNFWHQLILWLVT